LCITAELKIDSLVIYNQDDEIVERPVKESSLKADAVDKAGYRHYMLKEIYEQPNAVAETLEGRFIDNKLQDTAFEYNAPNLFASSNAANVSAVSPD
jgi:glucosamine--fructose-6-phosphate aminotransferase (isomerizing)